LPPLKTVAKLRTMQSGQVLEVLGTNPVGNKEDEGFHRFYFRKSA
jgi:TusA-related sulfurtransferase